MNQSVRRSFVTAAAMGLLLSGVAVTRAQEPQQPTQSPTQREPTDRTPTPTPREPADRAQTPSPSPSSQAEAKDQMAMGELMRVDTKNQNLTIKSTTGTEMSFRFTAMTKVTGATGGVAGLATQAGTQVTVHYTKEGSDSVASSIDVSAKKQG